VSESVTGKILQPPTLLVVDDHEGMRATLSDILDDEGFQVFEAANGEEAVATVRERQLGLVLMDVRMPVMDGVRALRLIKAIRPELPVIMMTAYSDAVTPGELRAQGCEALVLKPLDLSEVLPLLRRTVLARSD